MRKANRRSSWPNSKAGAAKDRGYKGRQGYVASQPRSARHLRDQRSRGSRRARGPGKSELRGRSDRHRRMRRPTGRQASHQGQERSTPIRSIPDKMGVQIVDAIIKSNQKAKRRRRSSFHPVSTKRPTAKKILISSKRRSASWPSPQNFSPHSSDRCRRGRRATRRSPFIEAGVRPPRTRAGATSIWKLAPTGSRGCGCAGPRP